jgi:hypothetical protein
MVLTGLPRRLQSLRWPGRYTSPPVLAEFHHLKYLCLNGHYGCLDITTLTSLETFEIHNFDRDYFHKKQSSTLQLPGNLKHLFLDCKLGSITGELSYLSTLTTRLRNHYTDKYYPEYDPDLSFVRRAKRLETVVFTDWPYSKERDLKCLIRHLHAPGVRIYEKTPSTGTKLVTQFVDLVR